MRKHSKRNKRRDNFSKVKLSFTIKAIASIALLLNRHRKAKCTHFGKRDYISEPAAVSRCERAAFLRSELQELH
jgi:hypothetical protein